ncbi:hypothetical protein M407DRAFT_31497 [Tulasnella calospora MUT 4182]|uniref:Uncharacterized protein n=1 Tax=Tulasnella calospora MUT 4182 TaxID=1051891 RepID=A0A0C3Q6E3_9AGAM|nr:hypothetical protein M407DRAFT_31497 [Tulasnella calospora MUT 4182]
MLIYAGHFAIRAFEAEYEEAVRFIVSSSPAWLREPQINRKTAQIEQPRRTRPTEKDQGSNEVKEGKQRGRGRGPPGGDSYDHSVAGPSSASPSTPKQHPQKRQRRNNAVSDPITSDDRDEWINHVVESKAARGEHYDLLKEFLSTTGRDRSWTVQQCNIYLKDNATYITRQIDQLKRRAPM